MKSFWDKVEKTESCWNWTGATNGRPSSGVSYGLLKIPKTRKNISAHRMSYTLHNGAITSDQWVLHKCDNPLCVNPDHLFLGDAKSNVADMISKGRRVIKPCRGESNGRAVMTKKSVEAIRELRSVMSISGLAEQFGVSKSQIHRIVTGQQWAGESA